MIIWRDARLSIFQSPLYQTLSSALVTDSFRMLVDPAWLPEEIRHLQSWVAATRPEVPLYTLFTHGDFDHVLGAGAFPMAQTIGHENLNHLLDKEGVITEIKNFDDKYYIERNHPVIFPTIDHPMNNQNNQLTLGQNTLKFWEAPGHTNNSLFTLHQELGILWVGDYLSNFELPFIYFCADAYCKTIAIARQLIESHDIQLLIPGHGKPTADHKEMMRRIEVAEVHLERLFEAVRTDNHLALASLEAEHPFNSDFTKHCHATNVMLVEKAVRVVRGS